MTFEFDADARKAIANHYGQKTMTYKDMVAWIESTISAQFDDLQCDYGSQEGES